MATSLVQLIARCTGGVGGELDLIPAQQTNGSADGSRTHATLLTGDNPIPIPTGTKQIWVCPPAGNTLAIKFGGSTGPRLHNTVWQMFAFDSSVTTFTLNVAAPGGIICEFAFL